MQVQAADILPGALPQFGHAADAVQAAAGVAAPDGDGRAPVALAADGPVHIVAEPFAEAPLADVRRIPVDAAVDVYQAALAGGGADVPAGFGVVKQGGIAAPAEGVGVAVGGLVVQQAALRQVGGDFRVGILDELAGEGVAAGDDALQVNRLDECQFLGPAQCQVLVAESGGDVDDAGAVVHTDEIGGYHLGGVGGGVRQLYDAAGVGAVAGVGAAGEAADVAAEFGCVVKGAVGDAGQLAARCGSDYPVLALEGGVQQGGCQNEAHRRAQVVGGCYDGVLGGGVHGQGGVAGQRPGGGRPRQKVGRNGRRCRRHAVNLRQCFKLDKHRRVGGVFPIPQRYLVGGQAGYAAGAVGSAAPILVEEALFPELLQDPPAGFDVVVFQRYIGGFHIHPEANAVGHRLPVFDIAEHALAAAAVEFGDAVFLDVPFGGEAKLLFHGHFHRQAVGVPAAFAGDAVALHSAVAADDILKDARQDMVDAGAAVGGGRALVHHKEGRVGAFRHGAVENRPRFPVFQDFGIQVGETDPAGNDIKHRRQTSAVGG